MDSTLGSSRHGQIGREGAIQPQHTPQYAASRSRLTSELLLELELVEEGIAVDPWHRQFRRERPDGSIVDYSAMLVGLLVAYEIGEGGVPWLLDLRDLTKF